MCVTAVTINGNHSTQTAGFVWCLPCNIGFNSKYAATIGDFVVSSNTGLGTLSALTFTAASTIKSVSITDNVGVKSGSGLVVSGIKGTASIL